MVDSRISVLTTASTLSYAQGAPPCRVLCGGWGLHDDLMRAHALNRGVAAFYFGDDGVVIVAIKPSAIADLPAGFGVERRVVEDYFAFVAGFELLCALAVVDDGEDFAIVRASLAVALEL